MIDRTNGIVLKYDLSICNNLRNIVKKEVGINMKKEDWMKKDNKARLYNSWNRVCACMDRIEDTLDYLNGMKLGDCKSKRAAFDFYDFVNCSYVIIQCIKALCNIFDVDNHYLSFREERKIFGVPLGDIGSDTNFFEYIRSLASVHPVETNRPIYIPRDTVAHFSPCVYWNSPITSVFQDNCELVLIVYTSNALDKTKHIYLHVNQFDEYLTKWIETINVVIEFVKKYNVKYVEDYKKISIKPKTYFTNIIDYLNYLKKESLDRIGDDNGYIFDRYSSIFNIQLSSARNQMKLEKYRNAIEYSLSFYSNSLQNMSNCGFENTGIDHELINAETSLFFELYCPINYNGIYKKYSYNYGKLYYLEPNVHYDHFDKVFARENIEAMIPALSKYVEISGKEPDAELLVLVDLAMYFDCLNSDTLLNEIIPNDLNYRIQLKS